MTLRLVLPVFEALYKWNDSTCPLLDLVSVVPCTKVIGVNPCTKATDVEPSTKVFPGTVCPTTTIAMSPPPNLNQPAP